MTVSNYDGKENIFAKEPLMYIDPKITEQQKYGVYTPHNVRAEMFNGRFAMIGFVSALVSYGLTGQIIPGVF